MKTKLYILLFAIASSMAITSCADDDIKPREDVEDGTGNTGGNGQQDPIKP